MALLETRQVCKVYKPGTPAEVRAVHEISLSIEPGQFALLTGPSGSGKTTLLALLGALARPSGGQVLFEGRDLAACADAELARLRRRMGFVFQNFSLLAGLPVWENVTYPLIAQGMSRVRRRALAGEVLGNLGLSHKLLARPEELSGGEQQRVAIARALASRPLVLLADEPTSNLDATAAGALLQLLRDIHHLRTTVVLSSHDPRLAELADVVHELDAGQLVASRAGS